MPTRTSTYGSMTVLAVEPALTEDEGEAFHEAAEAAIRAGGRWFVLDFAKATRFDSRGLEDLLWLHDEVDEAGGVVKVAGLKGHCRTIFEMVRFDKRFEVHETVHEAVRSLE